MGTSFEYLPEMSLFDTYGYMIFKIMIIKLKILLYMCIAYEALIF
jgi:hypothetical protein